MAKDYWDWQRGRTDSRGMRVPYGPERRFWVWAGGGAAIVCSLGAAAVLWQSGTVGGAALFLGTAVVTVFFIRHFGS